jgi:hypothetical protein
MTRASVTPADLVRYAGVALLLVVGGIHLQQFEGPLRPVPTIGPLFVLNAVGAAGLAVVLAGTRGDLAKLTALAGIAMTAGGIVALAVTRVTLLFNYSEPTLRPAVTLAAVAEVATIAALGGFVLMDEGTGAGEADAPR